MGQMHYATQASGQLTNVLSETRIYKMILHENSGCKSDLPTVLAIHYSPWLLRLHTIGLTLAFLAAMGFTGTARAWEGMSAPMLTVQGNQLKDSYGNTVLLHGWRISDAAYFCDNGNFFNSPTDYAGCLKYLKNVVNTFTHTNGLYGSAHGWYCNEIRLGCDGFFWYGDWADGSFDTNKLQAYTQNILIPFSQYCKSHGLYLVIFPNITIPQNTTTNIVQTTLLTIWNYWSALPQLKNAANVQFELCNEPINAYANGTWGNGSQPYYDALKNWLQPIVDTIRGNGAGNIIWVPGLGYQSQYAGYAVNPINGTNIGYAAHIYPAYGGVGNDPTSLQNFWNSNYKPCADLYPMNITETYWMQFLNGDNPYWQLFNGVTGNDTSGFGTALRHTLDRQGNVSWEIGITGDLITNADPTAFGTLNSQPGRDDAARRRLNGFMNIVLWDRLPARPSTPSAKLKPSDSAVFSEVFILRVVRKADRIWGLSPSAIMAFIKMWISPTGPPASPPGWRVLGAR